LEAIEETRDFARKGMGIISSFKHVTNLVIDNAPLIEWSLPIPV
jgi:hypothetical protein